MRANLLRPLSHLLDGDTLEIGAGCGALSRYVGELGGNLLSLEGSFRRAKVAAARCRSLDNVAVVCDRLDNLQLDHKFDAVLLVGVLEYFRLFSQCSNPGAFLSRCRRFLRPGGRLILAIENQLGLKYFCAAPEDHVGQAYFGVEQRYTKATAATWGRQELVSFVKTAGLQNLQEYFPFPDYKLPQVILTRDSLRYGPVLADLLSQYAPAYSAGREYSRPFSESAVWPIIVRNRMVKQLANSFLIVASDAPMQPVKGAFVYSSNRQYAFQRQTWINRSVAGWQAKRTTLSADAPPANSKFKWILKESGFKPGQVYSTRLNQVMIRPGWTLQEVVDWARPYYEFLQNNAAKTGSGEATLPGDFLDCGPRNLVMRSDGGFDRFDIEWASLQPLPLKFVLFRSVVYCLSSLTATAASSMSDGLLDVTTAVMNALGEAMSAEECAEYLNREAEFQSFVSGYPVKIRYEDWADAKLKRRLCEVADTAVTNAGREMELLAERDTSSAALASLSALQIALSEKEKARAELARDLANETDAAERWKRVAAEREKLWKDERSQFFASEQHAIAERDARQFAEQALARERMARAELEQSLLWRFAASLRHIRLKLRSNE